MTTCRVPIDGLFEADSDALEGVGDDPVAVHVRECGICADAAKRILEGQRALDRALDSEAAGPDVTAILTLAGRGDQVGARTRPERRGRRIRPRWVALAAAAAISGLLIWGDRDPRLPGVPLAASMAEAAPPLVEAAPATDFAVFETDNPDITVLWFF